MRRFTKEWLIASSDDLLTIHEIKEIGHLTHIVAFHAQQSVEKSLKALIEEYEIDIPKIHKLSKLQNILKGKIETLDESMLTMLDELYIDSRYPGDMGLLPHGKPSLEDAEEFYIFAQDVLNKVCKILKITMHDINGQENEK